MNISFLLGGFQNNGGIGRVTSILSSALSEIPELSISTISYCQTDKPLLYTVSNKVEQFHLYDCETSMVKAILLKSACKRVRAILRERNIDVLIACGALFYPLAILACKGTKTKCICWEHTNPTTSTDHKFQNLCRKFAVRYCDKMIVLTQAAEQYYLDSLNIKSKKITQIYNPVETNALQSDEYNASTKKMITVGRLSYPKNMERLIDIANVVLPKYSDWTWDIYGSGELQEKLQAKIDSLGLTEKVFLKGQVSDIYSRYKDYAFFVMTSRYEGFPMSLIEAAANRLPLVSFDVPTGPNEIITDGENGYLINSDETNTMIQDIERLICNTDLRRQMSEKAFYSIKKFDLNEVIKQWGKVFQEVVN